MILEVGKWYLWGLSPYYGAVVCVGEVHKTHSRLTYSGHTLDGARFSYWGIDPGETISPLNEKELQKHKLERL